MSKETKLLHIAIIDGTENDIQSLSKQLTLIKDKLPFDIEFIITNDKIKLQDVEHLMKELYILYKQYKKVAENMKEKHKND